MRRGRVSSYESCSFKPCNSNRVNFKPNICFIVTGKFQLLLTETPKWRHLQLNNGLFLRSVFKFLTQVGAYALGEPRVANQILDFAPRQLRH